MRVLVGREDLERDIRDLKDRLSEEHRSWMVSLELLQIPSPLINYPPPLRTQANISFRIYESMEALQKRVVDAQSDIVQHQAQNHSRTRNLIEQNEVVIINKINALCAEVKSIGAYVPQRRGFNILLTAEEVHGLQDKPPEVNACLNDLTLLTFDLQS